MNAKSILKTLLISIFVAIHILSCSKDISEPKYGEVIDARDSSSYRTVIIGGKIWMAENLAFKSLEGSWAYENDSSFSNIYGYLYDWETACKVCPEGWELPEESDWNELKKYIRSQGRYFSQGAVLRATYGWNENGNGTDDIGFSALPGGAYYQPDFAKIGDNAIFWTKTEAKSGYAFRVSLSAYEDAINLEDDNTTNGYSVRCIMK